MPSAIFYMIAKIFAFNAFDFSFGGLIHLVDVFCRNVVFGIGLNVDQSQLFNEFFIHYFTPFLRPYSTTQGGRGQGKDLRYLFETAENKLGLKEGR